MLQGKRSYMIAGLLGVVPVAFGLGFIDRLTFEVIMGVLLGGGVAAIRAGITNETRAVAEQVPIAVTRAVAHEVLPAVAEAVAQEMPQAIHESQKRDPSTGQFR